MTWMELHCMRHCLCPFKTQGELILRFQNVFTVIQLIWSILSIHFYVCDVCICFGSFLPSFLLPRSIPCCFEWYCLPVHTEMLSSWKTIICAGTQQSPKRYLKLLSQLCNLSDFHGLPTPSKVRLDTYRTSRLHKYLISIVAFSKVLYNVHDIHLFTYICTH